MGEFVVETGYFGKVRSYPKDKGYRFVLLLGLISFGCVMDNKVVQNCIEVDFSGIDENGNFYGDCIAVNIKDLKIIEYITIHLEIDKDIKDILSKIKSYGYKTGLSIKPNTDVNALIPYLDDLDLILLMTVEPGLGGQPFIESSIEKIQDLKKLINNTNIKIEVDGGINDKTITEVKEANIAVVGSYITKSENPTEVIKDLIV